MWRIKKGGYSKNRKVGDTGDSSGRAARSDTSHQNVDGESLTSMREMQPAEKMEDRLNQKKMETSEECGSSGMWRRSRTIRGLASITHTVRWKKAPAARGASTGQVKIDVMNDI